MPVMWESEMLIDRGAAELWAYDDRKEGLDRWNEFVVS
jgi:hypothetical protein